MVSWQYSLKSFVGASGSVAPTSPLPVLFFSCRISNEWGCNVFAGDPTVVHPAKLADRVYFASVGAKMLAAADNQAFFLTSSMPGLRRWLKHDYIDVLKMDCEGCEYSIARDVLAEDPDFFHRVGQFAVELHVGKYDMKTEEYIYSTAMLFKLLEEAGMELQHQFVVPCSGEQEAAGCWDSLHDIGLPCRGGKQCHNYLFARPDNGTLPAT